MAESLQMFVQTLQKSVDALKMLCVFFSLAPNPNPDPDPNP